VAATRPSGLSRIAEVFSIVMSAPVARSMMPAWFWIGFLSWVSLSRTAGATPMATTSQRESPLNAGFDAYRYARVESRARLRSRSSFSSLTRTTPYASHFPSGDNTVGPGASYFP